MTMATPSKKDIVAAIVSYSPKLLKKYLQDGYDVNLPLFGEGIRTFSAPPDSDEEKVGSEEIVALLEDCHVNRFSCMTFPLHLAVICLYHAVEKPYMRIKALRILDILLAGGARVDKGCGDMLILNASGYVWIRFGRETTKKQPVHLAMFLKQYPWRVYEDETHKYLDEAIEKLEAAAAQSGVRSFCKTPVLTGIADSYQKMLFSETFSDITFQCSDGTSIPAHKCILAANSEYFKTAFQGPWAENVDGNWKTPYSSALIKAILAVLYTGSISKCGELENVTDPIELFEVASEYDIQALKGMATATCIRLIHQKNLKRMLQLAKLHSNDVLKRACFKYVRCNAGKVLMHPSVMSLASDDPGLWTELGDYVNSDEKPNKRPRRN